MGTYSKLNKMTNKEIKSETLRCFKQIEQSHLRLSEIRSECKHEKTFEGMYQWRIGSTQPGDICEYCFEMVKFK